VPHSHEDNGENHRAHALNPVALFAYLLIFTFTVSGFYFIRINAPDILGQASYASEQIISLTNIRRAENGLRPLVSNTLLSNAAQAKVADMFSNNYWAHFSPQGTSPWNFITAVGYKYIYAGENLARDFDNPSAVVNAWMASPTHRGNLLDENFKEIGVAVSGGNLGGREGVLVVQMFGSSITRLADSDTNTSENVSGRQTEVESADTVPTTAIAEVSSIELGNTEATVLASRQFSLSRIISLLLIGSVFSLFVLEVAYASKKAHISIQSGTLAHLGLLALVLFAVWWATAGSVI